MDEWEDVRQDLYSRYRKETKRKGQVPVNFDEFIEKFKGQPGSKGDKGDRGAVGKTGTPGIAGKDGAPGLPGAKGEKGDKGDRGLRGFKGLKGLPGVDGVDGRDGCDGWTPVLSFEVDGRRRVLKVIDWAGGCEHQAKPFHPVYIGLKGFTRNLAEATDLRGEKGAYSTVNAGTGYGGVSPSQVLSIIADYLNSTTEYIINKDVDGAYTYIGEAAIGSADSDAAWRIKRIETATDREYTLVWADGASTFDKVWDNRTTYTYI